ncbi:LytTR family DNA-binding domain-containing protein [Anaerosacchariphilus polymeriproducens]|uniref:LytTR family transcriptional regulator n=1 Tax=Anaerosacchariphilus polymeriproducens TaxID=1812858 RepID=A0A371AQW1_9FIRM|nr:LytTR family DNA-binding domain-containing protein [Anaerosacchariphilus polymeriproducens]RDU21973.1 LytTR family transcriptional regulator [Anaerosacchariphilus polymeriproducens]
MKVRIDIDEKLQEEEVIIRCRKLDEKAQKVYDTLVDVTKESRHLMLYKENTEYYLPLDCILFFETTEHVISAHTVDNIYQTDYRLYELEEILPGCFMRVSKSTILNLNHIYSITRNLTASSVVQLMNTHKQVYVSRYYYKPLKCRLDEKRTGL